MSIHDKIIGNFEHHRTADERVVAAFPASTHNQQMLAFAALATALSSAILDAPALTIVVGLLTVILATAFIVQNKNYTVIATNERTVLAESSRWSVTKVVRIADELPVSVQIGPPSGLLVYSTKSLGPSLKIHRRMFAAVHAADQRNAAANRDRPA